MMKHVTAMVLVAFLSLFALTAGAAGVKIGVINAASLLEKAPQAESAKKRLEKEFAPRDKKLVAQQKEIKRLEDKLKRDSAVMSEDGRRKIERDILAKRRDMKRAQEEFREDLNIRRNEVLAELQKEVMDSIRALAKSEKYDIILSDGVVFAGPKVDITERVLQFLHDRYKSGKK